MLIVLFDPAKGRAVGSVQTPAGDDDFAPGDLVHFPIFGSGVVRRVNRPGYGAEPTAVVDRLPGGCMPGPVRAG